MRLATRVLFGVLVVATFAAFFVAQRIKNAPKIVQVARYSSIISPNGDGRADVRPIAIKLRTDDRLTLEVIDSESELRLRRVLLPGRLAVPAIAYDATPSGITPDGRTLVLIKPRRAFPRAETSFAIVDTRRLRIRRTLRLRGDFSFDAISPDGRLMYLIRYPSSRNFRCAV